MKRVKEFWSKRSNYEKTILGLFAAFMICCLGFFSGRRFRPPGIVSGIPRAWIRIF